MSTSSLQGSRIAFAGTPDFAVPTLEALAAAGAEIPVVFTQPDRPAGRGRRLTAPPVKRRALELGLHVEQPEWLDEAEPPAGGPAPDLLVVVAYGLLLPERTLHWPTRGCVNVHASLLPRWRGAAPIQRALLAGDAETGVSIMAMERGLDTGPVYACAAATIEPADTAATLHDRLATLGARLLVETLPGVLDGTCVPKPQDSHSATYAAKLDKAEARLDWRESAALLARRVRAYNPWPAAFAELADGRRLRILRAEPLDAAGAAGVGADAGPPGRVLAAGRGGIDVATGDGLLRLEVVQPAGGRPMEAAAYLAAHSLDDAVFV